MNTIQDFGNRFVLELQAYQPGKPIEETAREIGMKPEQIIKLASNENPLGPSPKAIQAMQNLLTHVHIYPDGAGFELRTKIAQRFDVPFNQTVIGNGSNEIIELLCHSFLNPKAELIAAEHAFVVYKLMTRLFGATYVPVADPGFVHDLDAMAKAITPATRLVFLTNPNNPTGTAVSQEALDRFMDQVPNHVVVAIDEAYIEFLDNPPDTVKYVKAGKNVCLLRTFSKVYGLSGVRIGYAITTPEIAEILNKSRQPFNTNAFAQAAAVAALDDVEHLQTTQKNNKEGIKFYETAFNELGLEYIPSSANFIMVNVGNANEIFNAMLQQGVILRSLASYALPEWIRITIGTPTENQRCISVLKEILGKN